MRYARIFLAIMAAVLLCYAIPFLWSPELLGRLVQLDYRGPNAFVEIRSFYGGLELGMALFFAWAAIYPSKVSTALVAFAFIFGCAGVARAWGIAQFGFADPSQPIVSGLEIVAAIAAIWMRHYIAKINRLP